MMCRIPGPLTAGRHAGAGGRPTYRAGFKVRTRHARTVSAAVLAAAGLLLSSACSGATAHATGHDAGTEPAKLAIAPATGKHDARPDRGIFVKVTGGKLTGVRVSSKGDTVTGSMNKGKTAWKSRWSLRPSHRYTVTARATDSDGKQVSKTSTFRTLRPTSTNHASVNVGTGTTYGVAMPIVVRFTKPVHNKAGTEKALRVSSSEPSTGAWRWQTDQIAVYRTKKYWKPHQTVRFAAHLDGERTSRDQYGDNDLHVKFKIGDKHVSTVDTDRHRMVVRKNGSTVHTIPVSVGRGGVRKYTTTSGVHTTMEKAQTVVMDSCTTGVCKGDPGYYKETEHWSVRISNSGEFVHANPATTGVQGSTNVSHGCVNVSNTNGRWFYNFSYSGDVVLIKGTDRELKWDNGWGYWQMPWKRWVKGSALHTTHDSTGSPTASTPGTGQSTPAPAQN